MSVDPAPSEAEPIAAVPLEYGGRLIDPLFPVLRVICVLLVVLGACTLLSGALTLFEYPFAFFGRANRYSGWFYALQIPAAIMEIIAGSINARRLSHVSWLWAWIWCVISLQVLRALLMIVLTMMPPPPVYLPRTLLEMVGAITQVALGSGMAICVMILLVYRRRMMTLP
jgi:hypothetical protein